MGFCCYTDQPKEWKEGNMYICSLCKKYWVAKIYLSKKGLPIKGYEWIVEGKNGSTK